MSTENQTMPTPLLECPFCGSAPNSVLRQSHDEHGETIYSYHEISCENRECGMMPLVNVNLEECEGENCWDIAAKRATEAWNQRTEHAAITKAREALAGLVRRCTNDEMSDEIPELIAARAALAMLKGGK